ncbi:hemerythrin domain-containing protein [Vibrio sp. Isolate25]|uniref:hemerythrin domain-containing protein n=1 Tax=Vibrio TaxID=662 RepID=UPI001EFDC0D2|nr:MULTISPECIES: hemerythrin domain-containing protein [Vibrio]MCG9596556.1 hemerythrin domain-containing protein [Vibrio sp. Isolate25]MCG9683660.1 hemerythrin domain-containing protein [Vibrio sp. Isolate23]USD31977.1 hemerythrin domain-containing protein [Vibrio sp. SCSIO 43186]USD45021.1 hemerythrin domain-containing protein [Vibrio sp. SCSIO 43145]USD69100.1 hemerythrin domain-containing protein [Vibrio sp. SCSIO 43139]
MMIERIRREHGYMVRLLAVLRQKIALLRQEQAINYSLVKEIVDYLAHHSERVHHPKEDILYHYYLEHYGHHQDIENLEIEHQTLSLKTHAFLDTVDMILQDAVVPQDMFVQQLEGFILDQKRHLDLEEQSILPLINQRFTLHDWQAVEKLWSINEDDPVFGDTIAEQYQQLASRVRQGDQECI